MQGCRRRESSRPRVVEAGMDGHREPRSSAHRRSHQGKDRAICLPACLPASHSKDVTADLKPSPSMPLPIIFDALVQCLFYSYLPARPCSSVAQLAPLPVIPIFAPHSSFRYSHHPLQPVSATLPRVPHYSNSHTIPARADSRRPLVPSLSASSTTRSSL